MHFGEPRLGCAPRYRDFQRIYLEAKSNGLNPCEMNTDWKHCCASIFWTTFYFFGCWDWPRTANTWKDYEDFFYVAAVYLFAGVCCYTKVLEVRNGPGPNWPLYESYVATLSYYFFLKIYQVLNRRNCLFFGITNVSWPGKIIKVVAIHCGVYYIKWFTCDQGQSCVFFFCNMLC